MCHYDKADQGVRACPAIPVLRHRQARHRYKGGDFARRGAHMKVSPAALECAQQVAEAEPTGLILVRVRQLEAPAVVASWSDLTVNDAALNIAFWESHEERVVRKRGGHA